MAYLGRKGASAALTSADIPDDSITSAKIPDDALDSEHYTDGSIDTAHIGDDQVTGAKIENNPTIAGNLTVSGDLIPATPLSHRNIIINGAMTVAQRGNGPATDTGGAGYYHTADRMFNFDNCVNANFTRETTNGVLGTESGNTFKDAFPYSWKFASNGTVSSIPAGDRVIFIYKMEGQDVQHLAKGTANAQPVTLSFWVKSTQTGNHQVNLVDNTNTRQIGAVYSVSSAGTWEKKIITFAGDTTGALANSNANALSIEWWLTAGSNYTSGAVPTSWEANAAGDRAVEQQNYVGGSGRTWQITGIQLEVGSNATPFEHRSYGEELARCKRYYQSFGGDHEHYRVCVMFFRLSTDARGVLDLPVTMRTAPTMTISAAGDWKMEWSSTAQDISALTAYANSKTSIGLIATTAGSWTVGQAGHLHADSEVNARLKFSAEF